MSASVVQRRRTPRAARRRARRPGARRTRGRARPCRRADAARASRRRAGDQFGARLRARQSRLRRFGCGTRLRPARSTPCRRRSCRCAAASMIFSATAGASVVLDEDLELHLRHEVDRVLGAAVHLGVTALAAEALHLGDGEPLHAEILHGGLHVVELERLDDRYDEFHDAPLLRGAVRSSMDVGRTAIQRSANEYPTSECSPRSRPVSSSSSSHADTARHRPCRAPHDHELTTTEYTSVAPTAIDLVAEQADATAENRPLRPAGFTALSAKKPEQQRADDAADQVHADDVERVVVA